eukprot:NODE_1921_length_529_cov_423.145833_g1562_i0.p1 GENE.NODE_1921_length_529_cov_423.145833_g1562_i0~~NODE_1921_length_529_cov_423.145833_g1562_i0.p1  ORF type:complete len:129 (+),score=8.21 NODE_1921_length_529_cov_423.145833_g1562_i0:33-419(+)
MGEKEKSHQYRAQLRQYQGIIGDMQQEVMRHRELVFESEFLDAMSLKEVTQLESRAQLLLLRLKERRQGLTQSPVINTAHPIRQRSLEDQHLITLLPCEHQVRGQASGYEKPRCPVCWRPIEQQRIEC